MQSRAVLNQLLVAEAAARNAAHNLPEESLLWDQAMRLWTDCTALRETLEVGVKIESKKQNCK